VESSVTKRKPKKAKKEKKKTKVWDTLINDIVEHKNPKGFDLVECVAN
jgi:hypothetical protein